jgi:MFS family permease
MRPLPRSVVALGVVSLLTDASSEMIYPLLPAFLIGTLGAGPAFLGLIEGVAEAVASLSKLVSGWLSDRVPRRKPLVVAGYTLSSLARPLVALASAPWHVLVVRFADRVGKGVRGAPRDALIAAATPGAERGRAYGFHRAMDHLGAAVGPALASAALFLGAELRLIFALALVPGLLSVVALVVGVREEPHAGAPPAGEAHRSAPLGAAFYRYLVVLALFTLGNSSDAFLILRAQQAGVPLALVPALWMLHSLVKAAASTPLGSLSDRLGWRRAIGLGFAVYALAYLGFAFVAGPLAAAGLFVLYALYHALVEGPERALVAGLAPPALRGRAFGLYHAVTGAMLLPASLLTGLVWQALGPFAALGLGAGLAGLAALALFAWVPEPDAR